MRTCQSCQTPTTNYKYCTECGIIVAKAKQIVLQRKRREDRLTPCEECKKEYTYTKYCRGCSQIVKKKKNSEYKKKAYTAKPLIKVCSWCNEKPVAGTTPNSKYCETCKPLPKKKYESQYKNIGVKAEEISNIPQEFLVRGLK